MQTSQIGAEKIKLEATKGYIRVFITQEFYICIMSAKEIYNRIETGFKDHSDPSKSVDMERYMRDQFEFYGIKSPERNALSKPFLQEVKNLDKDEIINLVQALWQQKKRELHYLAQEILFKSAKKVINEIEDIELLEWMITTNSWWDTVDFIAPKLMKYYFQKFPSEKFDHVKKWIESENIWLKRSAILFHLKTKEKTDFDLLFDTILKLSDTSEFFIDKAIGWVLREHAKKNESKITVFIKKNYQKLSKLSVKEALKHHPEILKTLA